MSRARGCHDVAGARMSRATDLTTPTEGPTMADLTELDEQLCEQSRWDFSDLRAL